MVKQYITVTALNRYLKAKFDQDPNLSRVYLRGELSNVKYHYNGHCYFTLKDEHARINCVMFSSYLSKLNFQLKDGVQVLVTGSVSVYEAGGQYQVYAYAINQDGLGRLYELFIATKEKLEKAGLFDENHKKALPAYPSRVGVITASTGAAVHDIVKTIRQRAPWIQITLFPSLVQGEKASENLIRQLNIADHSNMDVLIIGRGGGSIEELWAFNDEKLAKAIFLAQTPVISAVGHESDFTICDFVSDYRAATPTAAAVAAVPDQLALESQLNQIEKRMRNYLEQHLIQAKNQLNYLESSYPLRHPGYLYESRLLHLEQLTDDLVAQIKASHQQKCQDLLHLQSNFYLKQRLFVSNWKQWLSFEENHMQSCLENLVQLKAHHFQSLVNQLDALSPLKVLGRGYTITRQNEKTMTNLQMVDMNSQIEVEFRDGVLTAQPLSKKGV